MSIVQVGAPTSQAAVAPITVGALIQSGNPSSSALDNGFLALSEDARNTVDVLAHGTEPNGIGPTLETDDLRSFLSITSIWISEIAFFADLACNVTSCFADIAVTDQNERQTSTSALAAIQAPEVSHADNANTVLSHNRVGPIQPRNHSPQLISSMP